VKQVCRRADTTKEQEEKDYYDDLSTDLELADDDQPVLYKMGEAFLFLSLPAAKKQLRVDLKRYDGDIQGLRTRAEDCERGMKDLKVQLLVIS
jgi:prefoldin subunit 4